MKRDARDVDKAVKKQGILLYELLTNTIITNTACEQSCAYPTGKAVINIETAAPKAVCG